MNQNQNMSHQSGQPIGQAQEKANNTMDKTCNAAQPCKDTCQEAGQQMKAQAQGFSDACKNTVGAHK